MTPPQIVILLTLTGIALHFLLLAGLGGASLLGRPLSERWAGLLVRTTFGAALLCMGSSVVVMLLSGIRHVEVPLGTWFGTDDYHFEVVLLVDRLSLPFGAFSTVLCGVIGAFANRYMHREPGYNRFFVLLTLFALGMQFTIFAGTIEAVYGGWEMVGISSALLIGFFHDREAPVRNGLRTFLVYRFCDLGLLGAAVLIHHWCNTGRYATVLGSAAWPDGSTPLTTEQATMVTLLLLLAAMGKSAQVPFSGWLPRAMEGPTPSSAIFYGALSVHAGAYLLLRMGPLLEQAPLTSALVVGVGTLSALHATLVGRVQTDVKSALSYASLTQVSIILVEIGLGLRMLALLHLLGHAGSRALQFLRAPSLLHDFHEVENAIGGHLGRTGSHIERLFPARWKLPLYRYASAGGYLDHLLENLLVRPLLSLLRRLDGLERAWVRWLGGRDE